MKKFKIFLLLFSLSAFLTSCLKDPKITDDLSYGDAGVDKGQLVEFPTGPIVNLALNASDHDTSFNLTTVRLNSKEPAAQDITFTLALDPEALQKYNDEQRAAAEAAELDYEDYEIPTSEKYTIESFTVTIPKGERSVPVKVKISPSKFLEGKYALPLKIVSVSPEITYSANYRTLVTTVGIKNKYDGVYLLSGYHNRPTLDFPYEDVEMHLVTVNENTVATYFVAAANFGHPIGTGPGAISWYGSTMVPAFVFNTETNKVVSAYQYSPGGTVVALYTDATGPGAMANSYDPATKTLKVSWYYGNNLARAFFDTFVYEGPRN